MAVMVMVAVLRAVVVAVIGGMRKSAGLCVCGFIFGCGRDMCFMRAMGQGGGGCVAVEVLFGLLCVTLVVARANHSVIMPQYILQRAVIRLSRFCFFYYYYPLSPFRFAPFVSLSSFLYLYLYLLSFIFINHQLAPPSTTSLYTSP